MNNTKLCRTIDMAGRLVIPREYREALEITKPTDALVMQLDGKRMIITKYEPSCSLCGDTNDLVDYRNVIFCTNCIDTLYKKNTERTKSEAQ